MNRPSSAKEFKKIWPQFELWIRSRGSEVLPATNSFELARFTVPDGVGVIYRNGKDNIAAGAWVNGAREAFDAFLKKDPSWVVIERTHRKSGKNRRHKRDAIINRDGDRCIYCGRPFTAEDPETIEHFVPIVHGGLNHLSNLALAHQSCNVKAGDRPVADKIKLAIEMRSATAAAESVAQTED